MRSDEDAWFIKHGVTPPERTSHELTPDDIGERVKSVNPRNWRAEGHILIADTDMGELRQSLPTNVLFTGVDKKGLPTFKRL